MDNDKRCATCRHWEPPPGTAEHGRCLALPVNDDCDVSEPCRVALAFTEDMERYASALRTKADFGCVLHSAKEDADASSPGADEGGASCQSLPPPTSRIPQASL